MWDAENSFPKVWLSPIFISYFEITTFIPGTKSSIKIIKKNQKKPQ